MFIEPTKQQVKQLLNDYIDELESTEAFEKLIQSLIRKYQKWQGANIGTLLEPWIKNAK
jgi:hypothetical protein